MDESAFQSVDGSSLNPKFIELSPVKPILRQQLIDDGVHGAVEDIAVYVLLFACIAFFVSFAFYFATNKQLMYILGQVAMLQNIVYFPGFNILVPANVIHYFAMFEPIASFRLRLVAKMNDALYDLTPTVPLHTGLAVVGFASSSFITSAGTFLYLFWGLIILLIVCGLLTAILRSREVVGMRRVQQWLKEQLIFRGLIELIKIGQYGFLLGALINVIHPTILTSPDGFSYFMAVVLIIVYIGFSAMILPVFMHYGLSIPFVRRSQGLQSKSY